MTYHRCPIDKTDCEHFSGTAYTSSDNCSLKTALQDCEHMKNRTSEKETESEQFHLGLFG